jgi:membrane-anchored glycerophosphoryl diester phosphodiesterase (GDPDase)
VKFLAYVNKCALCILHSGKLIDNLCTEVFNHFLLEYIQPRLMKKENSKLIRSTIQYCIQVLHMFTCPQLTMVIFYFFFELPEGNNEEKSGVGRQSTMTIEKFDSLID